MNEKTAARPAHRLTGRRALQMAALLALGGLVAGTAVAASPAADSTVIAPLAETPAVSTAPTTPEPPAPLTKVADPVGGPGGMPGQHLPK